MTRIRWLATRLNPNSTRRVGISAQPFALLGKFVGLFTVAIGFGPRTTPDIVYHFAMVALLAYGLPSLFARHPNIVCSNC